MPGEPVYETADHVRGEGARVNGVNGVNGRSGDGLGRQLIAAAEHAAATWFGARMIEMTVIRQRTELIDYHHRHGYSPTGGVRPFPFGDERFGLPKSSELAFILLAKAIT